MLEFADIVLLAVISFILCVSIWATHVSLTRDAWKVQKYKLYKVRDNLIYLVASGKLKEDDFIFQSFYEITNHLINATNRINLASFIQAVELARKQGIDPAESEKFQKIREVLRRSDSEVQHVANSFYLTFLDILIENSSILRLINRYSSKSAAVNFVASRLDPRPTSRAAFKYYSDYSRAAAAA
ncbi:hypothetical protein MYX04_05280 [Nitrospiraceae bacterium AH_259_D15_M11_P09]|nr:hypothetical protein [Nitrospiraceae bacterium AH_259_D15_M11_P09]